MEYSSEICLIARKNGLAQAICARKTEETASSLVGIDYLRFRQEFPAPREPYNIRYAIIGNGPPFEKTMSYNFIKERTERTKNSVIDAIKYAESKGSVYENRVARYLLESTDPEEQEEEEEEIQETPGETSPFEDISPQRKGDISVEDEPKKKVQIEKKTGSYWSLWNTHEYLPWVAEYKEILQLQSPLSELEPSIKYFELLTENASNWITQKEYPFYPDIKDHPRPSEASGMPELLFTLLNVITGIYNREEYAFLYATRICCANGKKDKRRERLRQARLFAHNRIPMNENRDDIVRFDEYNGDWGKLRAIICLMNMQPQEVVANVENSLKGEDEIKGTHWVAFVFATGTMQNILSSGLETRNGTEGRKSATERRMYLIDPYIEYEKKEIKKKEEYVKTEAYGRYRQNILNRACKQCHEAGLISGKVICTSGYMPIDKEHPHKVTIYSSRLKNFGLLDYLLAYNEALSAPTFTNEIYYDRKSLITGTPEKELEETSKAAELFKEEFKGTKGIISQTYTMVIESLYPTCTLLYETPCVFLTPFFLISTIQSLLLSDVERKKSEQLFPYNTSEIFYALSRISQEGMTSQLIYGQSKEGNVLEYRTYLSPKNSLSDIYKQVTMPVFTMNMKICLDILKRLSEEYKYSY